LKVWEAVTSLCRDWGSGWGGGVFKKIQLPKYLVKPERAPSLLKALLSVKTCSFKKEICFLSRVSRGENGKKLWAHSVFQNALQNSGGKILWVRCSLIKLKKIREGLSEKDYLILYMCSLGVCSGDPVGT
jgi:hypothetical protein